MLCRAQPPFWAEEQVGHVVRAGEGLDVEQHQLLVRAASIGEGAFCKCSSLPTITLPDSVTSIDDRTFTYCSSLTTITIPDSVTSIGNEAFCGCTSLTTITIASNPVLRLCALFMSAQRLESDPTRQSAMAPAFKGAALRRRVAALVRPPARIKLGANVFRACPNLVTASLPTSWGIINTTKKSFF